MRIYEEANFLTGPGSTIDSERHIYALCAAILV